MTGPRIRTDIVDVYVVRASAAPHEPELLQLRRVTSPLSGTWQPIMGHVEPGESAVDAAIRELREEVGLAIRSDFAQGFWALEQVHPFFLPEHDAIVMSPRFVVQVSPAFTPTLNHEHDAARWVRAADVRASFMWPGQRASIAELLAALWPPDNPGRGPLAIHLAT